MTPPVPIVSSSGWAWIGIRTKRRGAARDAGIAGSYALDAGCALSSRFAANRRASVRLPVALPAALDGLSVELRDISLSGARAITGEPALRAAAVEAARPALRPTAPKAAGPALRPTAPEAVPAVLTFELHASRFSLRIVPRRRLPREDGTVELGLEFAAGQDAEIARLAVAIFQGPVCPEIVATELPLRQRRTRPSSAAA